MRRRSAWVLGLRLVRAGGARGWWSRVLVVVGVALAVVSALVCIAAAGVFHSLEERSRVRSLAHPFDDSAAQAYVSVDRLAFEDRVLLRVDVDPLDGELPLPPGLPRWPEPGEVFLSQSGHDLVAEDDSFRDLVPGDVVGTVGGDGLRTPDELVAYRGVPRDHLPRGGWAAVAQDAPIPSTHGIDTTPAPPGQVAALVTLLVVLAGLPVVAFLHVASRLSAATRRSRLAVLHFLGAPSALVRRVNTVEGVVLATVGWIVGTALFPLVNTFAAGSGVLGTTWFAQDTALTPVTAVVPGVLVVGLAVVVGARTDLSATTTRANARTLDAPGTTSRWRLVPLALGLTSLLAQVAVGAARPDGTTVLRPDALMTATVLVTGLGLILAMPVITRAAGRFLGAHGRTVAARLGGARAAFDPRSNARLVVALALMVMAAGVTIGQTRDARAVSTPAAAVVPVFVSASDLPAGAAHLITADLDAPVIGTATSDPTLPGVVSVAIATCDQADAYLRLIHGRGLPDCTDRALLVAARPGASGDGPDPAGISVDDIPALDPVAATVTARGHLPRDAALALANEGVDVLVTVDPLAVVDAVPRGPIVDETGATTVSDNTHLTAAVPREHVSAALAAIYRHAPYSQPAALGLDPDSGQNIARINGFIRLGLILGTAMTLLALATALADRATTRRRADLDLLAAGTNPRTVRDAHRWEVLAALGTGTCVALVSGVLGGLAWQFAGGLVREPDWPSIVGLALVTGAAIAVTVLVAATAVPRTIDPDALRSG